MADREGKSGLREAGETLVEVIIAVMIIGIVSAALAGAILSSLSASEVNRQTADADVVLRSYASEVLAESQSPNAWDASTGCLAPLDPPADIITQASRFGFSVSSPSTACTSPGFQGVVLSVGEGGFSRSLEIWVRKP